MFRNSMECGLSCAAATAIAAALYACSPVAEKVSNEASPPVVQQEAGSEPDVEYGEFRARPEELASVAISDIAKSLRLNATAMRLGRTVYDKACAECHGADLKGLPEKHAPDLTDAAWQFSGDDIDSGGSIIIPSDVEWTVRYGIRSSHPNTRGFDVDMLAFDPQFRNARDTSDFGTVRTLTPEETEDVVEYVLQLGGQSADLESAARGAALFQDNSKGNCYDCHGADGTGIATFGSTNLTKPALYLFGSDRDSIRESINRGRVGVMPAFEATLKPEEIKAVSLFVFLSARN